MWELDQKKAEHWRCFRIVVLEKTLKSPLDCKEIKPVNSKRNQPWIFIGRTDSEAEAPIFDHRMRRTDSLEKTLILGKTEGGRRRGLQRMRWLECITDSMDMSLSELQELGWTGRLGLLWFMGWQRFGHVWATELSRRKMWQMTENWDSFRQR